MTADTIQKIADDLEGFILLSDQQRKTLVDRLRALSARASAGEGGVQRNPAFVGEWHARAVALGYDGVADMLHSVERGEPPLHIAEVMARAAATAPQPAQDGASGGGEVAALIAKYEVREGNYQRLLDGENAWARGSHQQIQDFLTDLRGLTTPASPATGDAATWEEEIRRHDATPPEGDIRIGATRHYGGDDWFRELTVQGVTFLAPLDDEDRARHILARPTPEAQEARDAARWRALIGSARIRVLGSAGLLTDTRPDGGPWNGYAHIGLELWTKHEAGNEPTDAVEWLTKYTDTALALPAQGEGES